MVLLREQLTAHFKTIKAFEIKEENKRARILVKGIMVDNEFGFTDVQKVYVVTWENDQWQGC